MQSACKKHQEAGAFVSESILLRETDRWGSLSGKECLEPAYIPQKPETGYRKLSANLQRKLDG